METVKDLIPQQSKPLATKSIQAFTRQQIDLIKRTVAKGASDDELKLFLHIANKTGLDPFARQIHSVKRWNSDIAGYVMTTQTGIDGYRLIAERTGNYASGKDTNFIYDEEKHLVSATAYIMKRVGDQWFEVSATARYDEYAQKKKDGVPMSMWKDKPHVMLGKCAEALALRRAFPAEMYGVYVTEEIGDVNQDDKPVEPAGASNVLTPGELKYYHTQITNSGISNDIAKIEMNKRFNLSSSKDLNKEQAAEMMKWAKEQAVGQ